MRRALAVLTLLLAGCTVALEERMFFHPEPAVADEPSKWSLPAGLTARSVSLDAADGTRLHAVRVTREDAVAEVLYFGGDVFRTDTFGVHAANALAAAKVNVLIIDYRGYGRSAGTPTVDALQGDALAAYDWLRAQSPLPIVVHGFSLGSFIAAHVAAERQPAGLILESTATNVRDWAASQTPFFVRVKIAPRLATISNVERLERYTNPLVVIAGAKDRVTPAAMSRTLVDAARSINKELVLVPKGDHGDSFLMPEAVASYRRLIDRVGSQP